MVLVAMYASAQLKQLSFDQAFKGSPTNITKPMVSITGWADDEHYLEMRRDSAGVKLYSVEVKTGKAVPYTSNKTTNTSPTAKDLGLKDVKNLTESPDGKYVAYTRNNDLYIMELASKKESRVTNDGTDLILNGYASWIYFEEILGRASRYKAFWWSPDSRNISFMRFDDTKVPMFPIYVADSTHGYLENTRYPKPGDKNPEVKIGMVTVDHPTAITWADFNEKDDQYFGQPMYSPSGELWVPWMPRTQDELKIYAIDRKTGAKKEIYTEKQKTWIDLDESNRIEFLSGNKGFILKSDKDGWDNLYLHDASGKELNQITKGNFWGTSIIKVDEKARQIYFRSRKENSARFDFYKIGFDGKGLTRLSFGDYSHDMVMLSPNAKYFITAYSNVSTPTTMAIADMKGKVIREIWNSKGPDFDKYSIPKTELTRVKSFDGKFDLPVIITYPINFDPNKKYPVLVSIYGGPNAGTVYDRWKAPVGATMWWAQEGMIQVAFDNRSSGHFGKEGLNYIHRQLGKYEIEDYMACAKYLRDQKWVDTNKVAITGGSFGGYMTAMALTYGSDYFTHGIANASVTDWHLYDTHYTERFMDTPGENPEGYKNTSVMTYADRYKGLLRIVHGTTDDNVHMQNSIQLIDKLQELGKHFEFMVYPNERHGIGANSQNKQLHNRNEAYRFIYQNLIGKPMPEQFWGQKGSPARRGF
jgi:dipeptidyl-peptidase-4